MAIENFNDAFEYSDVDKKTTCKIPECNKQYSGYVTTNLWRHLQSAHPDIYLRLQPMRQIRKKCKFDNCVFDLRKALVELCSVNDRPFSIIEDTAFQRILEIACISNSENLDEQDMLNVFNKNQLKMDLRAAYLHIKSVIKSEVKGILISLMVDIRSKRGKSVLGMQIQYMQDDKIKVRTIGMVRMLRPHTGVYIAKLIEEKLAEYDISLNQIYTLTTDNGSNMLKAVSAIEKNARDVVVAEVESVEIDDGSNVNTDYDLESLAYDLEGDTHDFQTALLDENVLNAATEIVLNLNSDIENTIGLNCGAHTLQLEIVASMNIWDNDTGLLTDCRKIMNKLKNQNIMDVLVSRKLPLPLTDCKPRWWSVYLMVRNIS